MKLIVIEDGVRSEWTFDKDVVNIGRSVDNDLRIRDRGVSRQHCRIECLGDSAILVDLESQNGTRVNNAPVDRRPLVRGDVIQLGHAARICFESDANIPAASGRDTAMIQAAVSDETAVREVARERDDLLVLQRINRALNSQTELGPLLALIVDSAIGLTRAERGFLILDEEEGGMRFEVARNFARESVEMPEFKISRTIADEVRQNGRPVLSINAQSDRRFSSQASVVDLRLRSVMCIPIVIKERAAGVLYVDNRLQSSVFTEQDLELLEALGDQAAIAISNARLLQELRSSNEELRHARQEVEAFNRALGERVDRSEKELVRMRRELGQVGGNRPHSYAGILGESPAMQEVFRNLDRIVPFDYPVLIQGESGTGKELIARAIHEAGPRAGGQFVTENCGALSDSLLESELFGHTRGAFTGAHRAKKGLLELASGGTLFLDEVSEMSPEMQKKLLRVLQEGEVRPVGADEPIKVDVRIISAANRDLESLVKDGEFREDLYYRLKVLLISLPPLRKRRDDIPLLIEYFLERFCREAGAPGRLVDPEALDLCLEYSWPGNIRELENEVRKWVVLADRVVTVQHLSESIRTHEESLDEEPEERAPSGSLPDKVAAMETREIRRALRRHQSNKSRAAQDLGISRFTLQRKLEKYGLEAPGEDDPAGTEQGE